MSFDAQLLDHAVLLDAVTTGTGTAHWIGGGKIATFYVTAMGTVSAGKVQIESAADETFAGTWSPIVAEQTLVTDKCLTVVYSGPLLWVRARVSTNVTGGATATVVVAFN